ncbi:trypsin-like peptidase domain-containing protein [Actinokineospora iranica]|uniref:Serine protease n=1 Tax=Actinokineospora iranica TaxID=1271860 RepID=A0A1G6RZ25_9PSEU|nr:trypsin-like peptidase domain-containing protein [Actinokineospora iranica]SDD09922.1 Trypsin-like peptidase domain-containing protein [Actinokineospora iranica]
MTFAHLTPSALKEVQHAAIELGFADDGMLAALTSGIPPAFVASAMQGGQGVAKLMTLTSRMNCTRVLLSGQVPLLQWLDNAVLLAAGRPEEMVFRRALEIASVDGDAPPTTSPVDEPAAAVPDVESMLDDRGALEVVIAEDDTLDVGFLHTGAAVSRSVAKLVVQRHFNGMPATLAGNAPDVVLGTGWMIAPRLLVTNHHVVNARSPREPRASEADFALQGASATALFDYYSADATGHSTAAVGCLAHDTDLDFAILRLAEDDSPRPPLRLRANPIVRTPDRELSERVNVLQHPGGHPMRLGFRNNFVVSGSPDRLSYLTDTAGGSSGSAICDDAWHVAALHRGFQTIVNGAVQVWGRTINQENYGTPIGAILAHLAARHPEVHAEVMAGQG